MLIYVDGQLTGEGSVEDACTKIENNVVKGATQMNNKRQPITHDTWDEPWAPKSARKSWKLYRQTQHKRS